VGYDWLVYLVLLQGLRHHAAVLYGPNEAWAGLRAAGAVHCIGVQATSARLQVRV